ncbi:2'-5' RNA ligase family protein [Ferrovibrio sp.]|uniref:2'-5' RNA ligase family protein n=1 Tax=Ferrovibrio sp. TaxID=1917215 RepID=UPI00260AB059|nr:2'-5' RNA ligase family protein [Ferrovibrio sp.]
MSDRFSLDPLWRQAALSYTAVALAPLGVQAGVQPVLARVAAAAAPAGLRIVPAETLHLSLYGIAPVRSDFDKTAYWQTHGERALTELRDWATAQPPVTLRFTSLRATSIAVIAVAEPDDAVWSLRRRLAAMLPPPPGGPPQYDLIHVTLARYADAVALPADFAARISALPLDLPFPLHTVALMREAVYPALEFDILATLPLVALPSGSPEPVA